MDNYKFSIIFGDEERDGKTVYYGDQDELHIKSMIEFISEYYPEDLLLKTVNIRHQAIIAAYLLTQRNNIVFLNSTEYTKESLERYGKNGILLLPQKITQKQLFSLKEMVDGIRDYDILIKCNLFIEDGFLNSKTLNNMDKITPEIVDDIVNKNCEIVSGNVRKI